MLVTLIVFVIVFGVVVISHELGHFIIAKMNGIRVVEFAVGMGPELVKFTKGDTRYVLRLLPFGGACVFDGEDGNFQIDDKEKTITGQKENLEGTFNNANVWARISTVLAGPIFNIILAYLLALIVVGYTGSVTPVISGITDGYPAQEAGMQAGDVITRINGDKIYLANEVTMVPLLDKGKPVELEYKRGDDIFKTTVTPKFSEEDNRYYIGFSIGEHVECKGFDLLKYSAYEVRYWLKTTIKSLSMLVQGKLSKDDLSGPVGIANVIDETIEVAKPYGISTVVLTMINFTVLLSVNLGVMNLLPIPALDGGRLIFLIIEVFRGKPIPPEKEGFVHFIGFVALIILMVFVMFNDITRIFNK